MKASLSEIPFSRRGAWLALSAPKEGDRDPRPRLRNLRDGAAIKELLFFELLEGGRAVPPRIAEFSPSVLSLRGSDEGVVEICWPTPRALRIRGRGTALRLSAEEGGEAAFVVPLGGGSWIFNTLAAGLRLRIQELAGRVAVDSPWQVRGSPRIAFDLLPGEDGVFDVLICELGAAAGEAGKDAETFEAAAASVASEFEEFRRRHSSAGGARAETAAFILWSSIVEPENSVRRESLLSSKDTMNGIWSWDHCFNALALAPGDPGLAWDQILSVFDHQDASGALPDVILNRRIVWNFLKPPVHGWAILRLIREGVVDKARAEQIYEPLSAWTRYWFEARDYDRDGIPQYDHGNDSGWDNASPFSDGPLVESPELPAFLAVQMDALSELAALLGKASESRNWKSRAEALAELSLSHFPHDGRMPCLRSGSHEALPNRSLLPYLQLLFGHRLPASVREAARASLVSGGFLTEWGLATESVDSPRFRSDGYWLGPIWAPSTLLMVDALDRSGATSLSREIGQRYLSLVERGGFPENFDALTGEPLCDRGFSWTASVYLVLLREISADFSARGTRP